jgi:hypothetical protein
MDKSHRSTARPQPNRASLRQAQGAAAKDHLSNSHWSPGDLLSRFHAPEAPTILPPANIFQSIRCSLSVQSPDCKADHLVRPYP